jgi:hypothetical protein
MPKSIKVYDKSPVATSSAMEVPDIVEATLSEDVVSRARQALDSLKGFLTGFEVVLYEDSVMVRSGVLSRYADLLSHDGRSYCPWDNDLISSEDQGAFIRVGNTGRVSLQFRDIGRSLVVMTSQLGTVEELEAKMAAERPVVKNSGLRMGV